MNALASIRRAVSSILVRGLIRIVTDSGGIQTAQVTLLSGEVRDGVERFQNFGFTSNPPAGSEAVAVALGGDRGHLVIIAADDRVTRKRGLAPGDSAMHDASGQYVHLAGGTAINIIANTQVTITAPGIVLDGDLIQLAGGAAGVARVGDSVTVAGVTAGVDTATGTIAAGSLKVLA